MPLYVVAITAERPRQTAQRVLFCVSGLAHAQTELERLCAEEHAAGAKVIGRLIAEVPDRIVAAAAAELDAPASPESHTSV